METGNPLEHRVRRRLAEAEVLHQSKLKTTPDPEQRETLLQNYRRDRERLTSERDAKISKIRA